MSFFVSRNVFLAVSVVLSIHFVSAKEIPSYIKVCKRNDPHVEDCILNSVEELRPVLFKGIPELGVPPLDPLLIPELKITIGPNHRPGFRAVGHNVLVHGASGFKITHLKIDFDTNTFLLGLSVNQLYFVADYDVNVRIFNLPINGRGPIHGNATDIKGELILKGEVVKREGDDYLEFKTAKVNLKIKDFKVHIANLFGGDTVLTEATNAAINANSQEFLKSFLPVVEENVGKVMIEMANKITKDLKYDDVFPEE